MSWPRAAALFALALLIGAHADSECIATEEYDVAGGSSLLARRAALRHRSAQRTAALEEDAQAEHGQLHLLHVSLDGTDIAVARSLEDTSWSRYLQDKGARVTVEAASSAASDEAGAFVRFLVDNYDNLRNVSVFLHGKAPTDWHSPGDLLSMVGRIDADKLLKLGGYASLNLDQWHDQSEAVGNQDALTQARMDRLWKDRLWVQLLRERWGIRDGDFASWGGYCCAQFALHRDTVRGYPKEFYESLLETLTEPHSWGHASPKSMGRTMEYLWHVIFAGKPIRERRYEEADFTYDV